MKSLLAACLLFLVLLGSCIARTQREVERALDEGQVCLDAGLPHDCFVRDYKVELFEDDSYRLTDVGLTAKVTFTGCLEGGLCDE